MGFQSKFTLKVFQRGGFGIFGFGHFFRPHFVPKNGSFLVFVSVAVPGFSCLLAFGFWFSAKIQAVFPDLVSNAVFGFACLVLVSGFLNGERVPREFSNRFQTQTS